MVKVRGVWMAKLNFNDLALVVLRALAHKESRLTGAEVRFIRNHFEMTLQEFSGRFCVSHVAVMKWEKMKNQATVMNWATEKDIRLFILAKLTAKAQEFAKFYGD
jgi:hypothetical protein